MSRRAIQQPRRPNGPRCLDTLDRRLQVQRKPSEGRCFNDRKLSYEEGGTGQISRQAALDALCDAANATDEYVLTKDTSTGSVIFKVIPGP